MSDKEQEKQTNNFLLKKERGTTDYFNIVIEQMLNEIKADLKALPCKHPDKLCPQESKIDKIICNYEDCNKERITPLIESQITSNQKLDTQSETINTILNNQNKIEGQLTQMIANYHDFALKHTEARHLFEQHINKKVSTLKTAQETKKEIYNNIWLYIKYLLGFVGSLLAIYGAITAFSN